MSAISTLTLNDGAATPVAHTFTPIGVKNAIAKWQDKATGTSVAYPTITYSLREPTKASKVTKLMAKVVFPVCETIAPSTYPVKKFDLLATVEYVLPEQATLQNRKDLEAFVKNLVANAVVSNGVQTLESVWG